MMYEKCGAVSAGKIPNPMLTKLQRLALILCVNLLFLGTAKADITNGLVLYLPLDETAGTNALDSSTNAYVGYVTNAPVGTLPWTNAGRINGAAFVNPSGPSTNEFIDVPYNANLDFAPQNAFTIAAWVATANLASIPSGGSILCKGTGGGFEQYDLDLSAAGSASGHFRIVTRNSGGTATTVIATVGPTATYQHVAGVYDGTAHTLKIYINGQLNNTTSNANNLTSLRPSVHDVTIGNRQSGTTTYNLPFGNGFIDDVHIYNRALTASDVLELYSTHGRAPIISAQPRNYSAYVGDIAAFSVGIDAGNTTLPVGYQWQLGGTNIPGATNATLGITNVVTNFDGLSVAVVITNVIGTNTSIPTTLRVSPLPAVDITSGLVSYLKFDDAPGSTTAADFTANGNSGTLSGFFDYNVCWTNGLIGGGLNFNGDLSTGDLVAIPAPGTTTAELDFSTNGAFTLAAWVNGQTAQTNGGAVFAKGTGGGGEQFTCDVNGGKYRFYARNTNAAVSTAQTGIGPNGTWQHIVCVLDTNRGVMNAYINGQLAAETIAPLSLLSSTHEISIGNRQSSAAGYNLPWTGIIDDVHFYNRALTPADIQALYLSGGVFPPSVVTQPVGGSRYVGDNFIMSAAAGGTAPLAYQWFQDSKALPGATNTALTFLPTVASNAGTYSLRVTNAYGTNFTSNAVLTLVPFTLTNALAAWWTFDDGTNSFSTADSSTNGNIGNLANFPDYVSEWVPGRTNGAIIFNNNPPNTNEYVSISDAPSLNFDTVSNFSIAAWVRGSPSQVSGAAIIAKGYGGSTEEYTVDVSGGFYRFYVRNSAAAAVNAQSSSPPNGLWQHLVATYDGPFTTMNLYLNGVLIASNTAAPAQLLAGNGHEVSIGSRQSAAGIYNLPFVGTIDDVRLYNRTLSSNDVQNLYQSAGLLAPVFYTQPVSNATLFVGNNYTLSTVVDGTAPVTLQWQKNSTNIPNATNMTYSITNAQPEDAGTYVLIASNSVSAVSSSDAVVVVNGFSINSTAAYFRLDEKTGFTAADSSTNGNTGALTGSFSGDDSEWVVGRISGGLNLNVDGNGDEVLTAPDSPSLNFSNTLSFSLVAWVRGSSNQPANGAGVITKGYGGGGEQYALDVHNDGLPYSAYRFYVRDASGISTPMASSVGPNGRWQHVVATYDGNVGTMTLFVNAQQIITSPAPHSLLPSTHELSVGNRQTSSGSGYNLPFQGEIDDVRIYARALSANEVASIYALAPPFAPVVYRQPANATNFTGTSVTFSPGVDGSDPLLFQWKKNNVSIPGATNASLTLNNIQPGDGANYSLFATNSLGSTNTAAATLTVLSVGFTGGNGPGTGTGLLSNGTFQLSLSGPAGSTFHLYSTTDLTLPFAQWTLIDSDSFDGNGSASFIDQNAVATPRQFYRFTVP